MIVDDKTLESLHAVYEKLNEVFSEISQEVNETIQSIYDLFDSFGKLAAGTIIEIEKRLKERGKWLDRYPKTVKDRMIDKRVRCYHCRNNC